MQAGKQLLLERLLEEYRAWRAVPEDSRAAAPAWWWGTALELRNEIGRLPDETAATLNLPVGSSYADAAARLMELIASQTSLSGPAGFPWKLRDQVSGGSENDGVAGSGGDLA